MAATRGPAAQLTDSQSSTMTCLSAASTTVLLSISNRISLLLIHSFYLARHAHLVTGATGSISLHFCGQGESNLNVWIWFTRPLGLIPLSCISTYLKPGACHIQRRERQLLQKSVTKGMTRFSTASSLQRHLRSIKLDSI
jgi:hypothetical protein